MKKKLSIFAAALTATALLVNITPVMADELTNVSQSGDTTVTAKVSNGAVSYMVSIPESVDFGTLKQPRDEQADNTVSKTITVAATQLEGLTGTDRLVVLMQDLEGRADYAFYIKGQDDNNADKKLEYVPKSNPAGVLVSDGNLYANGFLIADFKSVGEVNLDLVLDQNQLIGVDLSGYAGSYQGTISFYSKIVDATQYIPTP